MEETVIREASASLKYARISARKVKIVADFGNVYESEYDLLDFIKVYGDRATLHRERINSIINAGAIELCTLIKGKDYNEKFLRLFNLTFFK